CVVEGGYIATGNRYFKFW
nr:immunoglobulin heavy chain junction region [Macaca mulatta]